MNKNETIICGTLLGVVFIILMTALILTYKTNLAYIEAGYSQSENNRWVKPVNCNCPPNNPQQPEGANND